MSTEDLQQRLAYFEQRLAEATGMAPKKFSEGFTTTPPKTWPEAIALIKERIAGIQKQLPGK